MINKPRISKWIGRMYTIITIFILAIFVSISLGTNISLSPLHSQIFFYGIMVFVLLLLGITSYSFYRTKYVINEDILYSWSPYAVIKIKLKDIKKVERTIVPFHIRVGASLYAGRFYIPSLGWTKSIITNLSDGILITTKDNNHYLITPSNPDRFAKLLKK